MCGREDAGLREACTRMPWGIGARCVCVCVCVCVCAVNRTGAPSVRDSIAMPLVKNFIRAVECVDVLRRLRPADRIRGEVLTAVPLEDGDAAAHPYDALDLKNDLGLSLWELSVVEDVCVCVCGLCCVCV